MKLQEILRAKSSNVFSIKPDATLAAVVEQLVLHGCGSLVVLDAGRLVGIITERDILKACAEGEQRLGQQKVRDVMSAELTVGSPGDSVNDVMGLMTDRRIRHLPVLEGDKLVGIISIGDIVKAQHDRLSVENHYLKTYIQS